MLVRGRSYIAIVSVTVGCARFGDVSQKIRESALARSHKLAIRDSGRLPSRQCTRSRAHRIMRVDDLLRVAGLLKISHIGGLLTQYPRSAVDRRRTFCAAPGLLVGEEVSLCTVPHREGHANFVR